jgi:hypothetical protein
LQPYPANRSQLILPQQVDVVYAASWSFWIVVVSCWSRFRYDAEFEPMNLDRQVWQKQAETLVEHVAAMYAALP